MAQPPVLKVTGLKKAYGAIQAVGGVSFEVMPGEIFGVIGPNGSGKTTMFNSVLGQIRPDAGSIELNGEDITGLSGLIWPSTLLNIVVLPEPLGPMTPKISPGITSKLTPSTALIAP